MNHILSLYKFVTKLLLFVFWFFWPWGMCQRLNPHTLHWKVKSQPLDHKGSLNIKILKAFHHMLMCPQKVYANIATTNNWRTALSWTILSVIFLEEKKLSVPLYLFKRLVDRFKAALMNIPGMQETQVQSLSLEDPLKKEMATHSSILAWKIPWMQEPGGLQSTG